MKQYRITVNGQSYDVSVEELGGMASQASRPQVAATPAPVVMAAPAPVAPTPVAGAAGSGSVRAPMPGTVTAIKVTVGQAVRRGDVVLLLEAMKMENEIVAPTDGTIKTIRVQAGTPVNTGDAMVDIG